MSNLTDAIEILSHGPAKDTRTAFECAYGVDSEQSALSEIDRLLPAITTKAGVFRLLKLIAESREAQSTSRYDDAYLMADGIEDCRLSLEDELAGEPVELWLSNIPEDGPND